MKIIFTGGTGFIGKRLIEKIMANWTNVEVISLVEEKYLNVAEEHKKRLNALFPTSSYNYFIYDIREKPSYSFLKELNGSVFLCHLAAVYDLSIAREIGWEINVNGTKNVIELAESLNPKVAFIHFSTCYVSGNRKGVILESELEHSSGFKNFYEETKYESELIVRKRLNNGLKGLIIRPSIVVGDSKTGETSKFDGIYFAFLVLTKFRNFPFGPPKIAKALAEVNIVPVNYIVDVSFHLLKNFDNFSGKTFHVSDPSPLSANDFYELCSKKLTGKTPSLSVNESLFSLFFKIFRKWFQVPDSTIRYFTHNCHYDCSNTLEALQGSGISCPKINNYIDKLIEFYNNSMRSIKA